MSAPDYLRSDLLAGVDGLVHGFFGRRGGVSQGIFSSLNISLRNADDRDAAWTNRQRIAGCFGKRAEDLVILRQVHGTEIREPNAAFDPLTPEEGDGLVTAGPGQLLGVSTADCAPLLIADPQTGVAGAAHAGWRGALSGISDRLIEALEQKGGNRQSMVAVIGPCIAQASYEVGPEFEAAFLQDDPDNAIHFQRPHPAAKPHFDLEGYLLRRLDQAGIKVKEGLGVDTMTGSDRFFSCRRSVLAEEPGFGLQVSVIGFV